MAAAVGDAVVAVTAEEAEEGEDTAAVEADTAVVGDEVVMAAVAEADTTHISSTWVLIECKNGLYVYNTLYVFSSKKEMEMERN